MKIDEHFHGYLVKVAPDIQWITVQDLDNDYSGRMMALGWISLTGRRWLILYLDYYGSCSCCGAWGEGGEPQNFQEVLGKSILFADPFEYFNYKWTDNRPEIAAQKLKKIFREEKYGFVEL